MRKVDLERLESASLVEKIGAHIWSIGAVGSTLYRVGWAMLCTVKIYIQSPPSLQFVTRWFSRSGYVYLHCRLLFFLLPVSMWWPCQ
jgi:hypothetical protein